MPDIVDKVDSNRLKLLGRLASGATLDVGCQELQNPYLVNAVGFDVTRPARMNSNYSRFVLGDCLRIDSYFPAEHFDTIVAGEVIEHLENPTLFLIGCRKILKSTGTLLVTTPNPYHWTTVLGNALFSRSGMEFGHINLFPFRTMVSLMRHSGWDVVDVKNASGGMRLWHTGRKFFIPCPKAVAWQLLYVCRKVNRDG